MSSLDAYMLAGYSSFQRHLYVVFICLLLVLLGIQESLWKELFAQSLSAHWSGFLCNYLG